MSPRGLLHGLGNAARHIPGPFVEQGVVLDYQEGVMILLKDSPELDEGEGPPHMQLNGAAVQPAEDARADAGDKEDPELLQVGLPLRARASISSVAMRGAGRRRAGVLFP